MLVLEQATVMNPNGELRLDQTIAIANGLIEFCGSKAQLPVQYQQVKPHNCQGKLITPGLIDCHTHLVYAGNRATEFKQRLDGMSYADIARHGGGILSTVHQTRLASEEELLLQSLPRILALRAEGVTTVEIKSGYGLDFASELKMLRVAKKLGNIAGVRVKTTFLGAHAIPSEYKHRSDAYIDFLCQEVLPAVVEEGLADALDVFCETIGFSLAQTEKLFLAAEQYALPVKCHAEQLSNLGASKLASSFRALSCDHLEYLDEAGVLALAEAGTVAVLLPGAYYFLRETKKPPIDLLRKHKVSMAIATDSNPGSSPTTSLLLMVNMACQLFGFTVAEALNGVTHHAAQALGLQSNIGRIEVGLAADLVLWSITEPALLAYYFGYPIPQDTMIAGNWVKPESQQLTDKMN